MRLDRHTPRACHPLILSQPVSTSHGSPLLTPTCPLGRAPNHTTPELPPPPHRAQGPRHAPFPRPGARAGAEGAGGHRRTHTGRHRRTPEGSASRRGLITRLLPGPVSIECAAEQVSRCTAVKRQQTVLESRRHDRGGERSNAQRLERWPRPPAQRPHGRPRQDSSLQN